MINDPDRAAADGDDRHARSVMREYNVSGIPIVEGGDESGVRRRTAGTIGDGRAKMLKLVGIMTRRDLKFQEDDNRKIGDVMTRDGLITAPRGNHAR